VDGKVRPREKKVLESSDIGREPIRTKCRERLVE